MESRIRAAATAASLIPFSCCCCFEEFNLTNRTPMVLPCGHTYVCSQCTKRLSRCMECREPLFLTGVVPQKSSAVPTLYNRGRYSPQPQTPDIVRPTPVEKVMLPIPKNVVLMSMMEAAQRQVLFDQHAGGSHSMQLNGGDDEDEEYNLDKVISGLATLSGPCGTYAVKRDNELCVIPVDPRRKNAKADEEKKVDETNTNMHSQLRAGQTVQIVSFEDGVAKLARGAGFIVSSGSQLVKVAGPREATCRLEGLLETIESRGKDLETTLDENRQIETSLRQQIEISLKTDPDHPVIADAALTDMGQENNSPRSCAKGELHTPTGTPVLDHGTPDSTETNTGARMDERVVRGNVPVFPRSPASPNSIDNADIAGLRFGIPGYRRSAIDNDMEGTPYGCGNSLLESGTALFGHDAVNYMSYTTSLLPSSADPDLHHSHSIGHPNGAFTSSDDPYAHGMPMLTASFDAVDFRTGLSGHRGLTNVKKTGANSTPRSNGRMMRMSEHRGIGRATVRQNSPTSSPSPAQRAYH